MSTAQEAWLGVLQAGQPGASAWHTAFTQLGDVESVCGASAATLQACGLTATTVAELHSPDTARLSAWRDWLAAPQHQLLTRDDPGWPQTLAEGTGAPLALWLRGAKPELLDTPQLAIVGSRNATSGGRANARAFAQAFGHTGLTVTSGLAFGIDAAAHTGALLTPGGTLAVLGNGIDRIYPQINSELAQQIITDGLIVSEYAPGTPAQRFQFPARNRIIAALSLGVLVVEAGPRSGSLITARLAGDMGREIFAIPGSIHNPLARGCHRLIRDGAKLVESAADVLVEIAPRLRKSLEFEPTDAPRGANRAASTRHNLADTAAELAPDYAELLESVGFDPVTVGDIVTRSTLTTAEVSSMLLLLELEGHVEALPGGRYTRIK